MKQLEKPPPGKEAPRPSLSRFEEEARRVINDYAEALREIIKKLRRRLN
jgi:signal recognition particle subunit SEC65